MSNLYTTNAFAIHFIKNTHLHKNLSKRHYASFLFILVPYLLLFIYYCLFFCACKLSKYCNYLQNFQVQTSVFSFSFFFSLFYNFVKVCYKEWYFKKYAKNFVIQLATFGISNKNHHYSNPSSSIVTIEFIIIK